VKAGRGRGILGLREVFEKTLWIEVEGHLGARYRGYIVSDSSLSTQRKSFHNYFAPFNQLWTRRRKEGKEEKEGGGETDQFPPN